MASGSLSDDDIKFVLSVDPDQDALNKAIQQINADIEKAQVAKIRLELEKMWKPPDDVVPVSFWEKKFGHAGEALRKEFELAAETLKELKIGADPDVLRQRIANEREVAAVRKDLERAEQREREKQAGGAKNLLREQMGADPASISERVKRERDMAAVRDEISKAEHAERVKQAGGKMAYFGSQMKGLFSPGGQGGMGAVMGGILGGQGGGGTLGQVGGMAGMAMGGPAGAEMGSMLAKMIPEKIAGPARTVANGLNAIQGALQGIQGPLGPVGAGLDMVGDGIEAIGEKVKSIPIIGEILGPMIDQFARMPAIFKGILESMVSLSARAAPGVVKQLTLAVEDFQATIGQSFTPVVEFVTDVVRDLADVMAAIMPTADELSEALIPLRSAWMDLRDTLKDIAPDIHQGLVAGLKLLGNALGGLMRIVDFTIRGIYGAFRMITAPLRWLGLMKDAQEQPGTGQQAISAARTPWMGGIEEYQRKLQMSSLEYSAGGRSRLTAESVPQNVNNIATMVANIEAWFKEVTLDKIVQSIRNSIIPESVRDTVDKAQDSIAEGIAWVGVKTGLL